MRKNKNHPTQFVKLSIVTNVWTNKRIYRIDGKFAKQSDKAMIDYIISAMRQQHSESAILNSINEPLKVKVYNLTLTLSYVTYNTDEGIYTTYVNLIKPAK